MIFADKRSRKHAGYKSAGDRNEQSKHECSRNRHCRRGRMAEEPQIPDQDGFASAKTEIGNGERSRNADESYHGDEVTGVQVKLEPRAQHRNHAHISESCGEAEEANLQRGGDPKIKV